MKPNLQFKDLPPSFWAHVRTISQEIGYTDRKTKNIRIPTLLEVKTKFKKLDLSTEHLCDANEKLTDFGQKLFDYFEYRAFLLDNVVKNNLMDKVQAKHLFDKLRQTHTITCPLPMNKQTAEKKDYAFFTCIINILIEHQLNGLVCDYDPRSLTTVTKNRQPLRTLSRRVDGTFPSVVNPIAMWEIKEYYYTKTFGSRVADGVYETLLDGMEINELEQIGQQRIHHILFIDDKFTWWDCGRSYLCRIIDMLNMGYVDEVIVGKEVIERVPKMVKEWVAQYHNK